MTADVTLEKYHGDTWILPLTFYGADGETLEDLEGISVKFSVKKKLTDGEIIFSDDHEDVNIDYSDAAEGKITIRVEADLMKTLMTGKYFFDVEFTTSDGIVETQLVGVLKLKADVTP